MKIFLLKVIFLICVIWGFKLFESTILVNAQNTMALQQLESTDSSFYWTNIYQDFKGLIKFLTYSVIAISFIPSITATFKNIKNL